MSPRSSLSRASRPLSAAVRTWVRVVSRPRRFFSEEVSPGDQVPGLVFAVVVSLCYAGARLLVAGDSVDVPFVPPDTAVGTVFVLLGVGLVVAPLALHLAAALQTVLLIAFVRDRAGVSETVQVIGYATAPCALAGLPLPWLRVGCALYGGVLLVLGLRAVHETTTLRAAAVGILPAVLVFGYGFGGVAAFWKLVAALAG